LQQLVKSISSEANLPLVGNEQIDFTMKLFDLNQVGKMHMQNCRNEAQDVKFAMKSRICCDVGGFLSLEDTNRLPDKWLV